MQTPREILAGLWTLAGGEPAALDAVTLTGEEPLQPSSFRVAAAAQAGSQSIWQNLVDALVVAGNRALAPYSE